MDPTDEEVICLAICTLVLNLADYKCFFPIFLRKQELPFHDNCLLKNIPFSGENMEEMSSDYIFT